MVNGATGEPNTAVVPNKCHGVQEKGCVVVLPPKYNSFA